MVANAPYFRGHFSSTNVSFAPPGIDENEAPLSTASINAVLHPDRQPSETLISSLEENHNLVELLEAATTAAGQAVTTMGNSKGKRKRTSDSPGFEEEVASQSKRARADALTDPQLEGESARQKQRQTVQRYVTGNGDGSDGPVTLAEIPPGVHSAAALFRRPSETTQKHTRPPMSKLFMSLQLSPENFLLLQAQAKAYMLDPAHPERQSCVGNRGKGVSDIVKLRLFNCVHDFLKGGAGEQFFGAGVEKPGKSDTIGAAQALGEEPALTEGKLVWPRDGNKLISLVTPLLRRMVTNERQRMYAIETRKVNARKKEVSMEAADQTPTTETHVQESHALTRVSSNPSIPDESLPSHILDRPAASSPPQANTDTNRSSNIRVPRRATPIWPFGELDMEEFPQGPSHQTCLRHLNISLKQGPHIIGIARYKHTDSAPLFNLGWQELRYLIDHLLNEACSKYRQLGVPQERRRNAMEAHGIPPEALRSLAAAVNTFRSENLLGAGADADAEEDVMASAMPMHPSIPAIITAVAAAAAMRDSDGDAQLGAPAYRVEAMSSEGRKCVESDDSWRKLKEDVARADWADGTLSVVVIILSE